METNFDKWKELNKEFCSKSNLKQIQCLYITQLVISQLQNFGLAQIKFDKAAFKIDINKTINKLVRLRNIIKELEALEKL